MVGADMGMIVGILMTCRLIVEKRAMNQIQFTNIDFWFFLLPVLHPYTTCCFKLVYILCTYDVHTNTGAVYA